MIEMMDTGSERALGIRITGKIEREDMDKIVKAAEAGFKKFEKLTVYVEVVSFGGISLSALIEDLAFAIPNYGRFEKKAVVSDKEWLGKVANWSDKFVPGITVRHFTPDERDKALEWVRA